MISVSCLERYRLISELDLSKEFLKKWRNLNETDGAVSNIPKGNDVFKELEAIWHFPAGCWVAAHRTYFIDISVHVLVRPNGIKTGIPMSFQKQIGSVG